MGASDKRAPPRRRSSSVNSDFTPSKEFDSPLVIPPTNDTEAVLARMRFEKPNLLEELLGCQALTLLALQMAPQEGAPTVVHSGQSRQYAVRDHVDLLTDARAVIGLFDSGPSIQHALVERFYLDAEG